MLRKTFSFVAATLVLILAVAGPLYLVKRSQINKIGAAYAAMAKEQPPTTVTATKVERQSWENTVSVNGTITAVQGVTVSAEVAGKVTQINFEAGASVKAGDLLVQLDTSTEAAQLNAALASAALAKANLARARELREANTNSAAELDAADAQAKQANAQVENLRAVIAKKTIRAPFAGKLGLRLINLGQILKEGDAIVSLQTLDPIYINFSVPEQQLADIHPDALVHVHTDAAAGEVFDGKVNAVNPDVDPVTRSVRAQATLPNPDGKLRPGMFAEINVVLPTQETVLAIPATAVVYAPYGNSVFVIDEKKDASGKVEQVLRQQLVRLGATRGDFVTVENGLNFGETIVTSGVFKLRPGMAVKIDNTLAPKAELNPKPKNA